jgi:hypothetical protein
MNLSGNEPRIAAIARRLSDFLFRQPDFRASSFAERIGLTEGELRAVLAPERALIDAGALIDLITEVIRHYGVDANWLLTGEYDPATHRELDEQGKLSGFEVRRLLAERLPTWPALGRPAVQLRA